MKKALLFGVAMVCMLVMTSCGSSNTPKNVAEKSIQCLIDKDFKGYVDLIYFSDKDMAEQNFEEKKTAMTELMQNKYNQSILEKGSIVSYDYVSEEVKDSTAVVKMALKYSTDKTDTTQVKLKMDSKGDWKLDQKGK